MSWTIESVREAPVDPAAVFALYADPATWSRWGHNATWAQADGPLVQGGMVDVRANYRTVYHCLIRRLEPGRALELVVHPALMTIVNVYEVEPTVAAVIRIAANPDAAPEARPVSQVSLPERYGTAWVSCSAAVGSHNDEAERPTSRKETAWPHRRPWMSTWPSCPTTGASSLEELRKTINAAAPDATETIAYQMPALRSP